MSSLFVPKLARCFRSVVRSATGRIVKRAEIRKGLPPWQRRPQDWLCDAPGRLWRANERAECHAARLQRCSIGCACGHGRRAYEFVVVRLGQSSSGRITCRAAVVAMTL